MRFADLYHRSSGIAVVAIALLTTAGCAKTGKVSGKVTFDGKSLPAGQIKFVGDNGRGAQGMIADGEYEVPDAPIGPCKVTVDTSFMVQMSMPVGMPNAPPEVKKKMDAERGDMTKMLQDMRSRYVEIPMDYKDPEKSGLEHTVTAANTTFDIPLKKPAGWKPMGLKPGDMPRKPAS